MPLGASRAGLMSVAADDIPDSQTLQVHYDAQDVESDQETITSVSDLSGNGYDLDASEHGGSEFTYVTDGINGNPSFELDGGDHLFGPTFSSVGQPYTIYTVVETFDFDSEAAAVSMNDDGFHQHGHRAESDDGWVVNSSTLLNGSTDSNIAILGGIYDDSDSEIREDGAQTGSGDAGDGDINSISVGRLRDRDGRYWDGLIGEVAVWNGIPDIDAVDEYFAEKWDVSI